MKDKEGEVGGRKQCPGLLTSQSAEEIRLLSGRCQPRQVTLFRPFETALEGPWERREIVRLYL